MTRPRSALPRALLLALVVGGLSCIDAPTAPRPVVRVTATPEALSLRPLDTVTVAAQVATLDGVLLAGRPLSWQSLDTTVALVLPTGLVAAAVTAAPYTGPTRRTTSILVATPGATTDTIPVEVLPWAVARVIAGPAAVTIAPRDSAQLAVAFVSERGLALTGRTVVWIADDTAVAQVTPTGRVRARAYTGPLARTTLVVVFSEGKADSVVVTVPPLAVASVSLTPNTLSLLPGAFATLTAVVRSASGETLTDTPLKWKTTDTTVVQVNSAGILTGVFYVGAETRSASVIVTHGIVADTTLVEVVPLSVTQVSITPDSGVVLPGAAFQLDASVKDAAGLFLTGRPVSWSSTDTTIARVDATGLVTAVPYGGTRRLPAGVQIIARSGGVADTVSLRVPPHAVFSLAATPERLTLQPLDSAQLVPRLEALDGTVLTGRSVTWRAVDSTVARVDAVGRVTAGAYTGVAVRTTAMIGVSGAAADTVPVEVLPLAVQRVVVAPDAVTLGPLGVDTLRATTLSASGLPLTGHPAAWVSSDTSIVQVSGLGVVTARPYYGPLARTVQVVVFSAGVADTALVTVQPLTAASLQIAPSALTLVPGAIDALSALVRSAAGDTLTAFPLQWRSADTTIVRVNVAGDVTASYYVGAAVREVAVIVSLGALADTTRIQVQPLSVANVTIADNTGEVSPGRTLQLDAAMRDAAGLLLTGRSVVWTSSDTSLAQVDASGLVLARPYGGAGTRAVQIRAASGSAADTVTLTLPVLPVAWITATPEALSVLPLDTATVTVRLESIDLIALSGRSVAWISRDTTIARVDAAGRVTASAYTGAAVRTTSLLVSSGAIADTVPIEVRPFAVQRVVVSPAAVTLTPTGTAPLSAEVQAASGLVLSGHPLLWLSSDTAVAVVNAAGLVTAKPYVGPLERSARIIVYSSGVADTTTVTVAPIAPSSIVVAPDTVVFMPGAIDSLRALVRSVAGDTLRDTPLTWSTSDTTVVRVNTAGVVTASFYVGADTRVASVAATVGALADTATMRVEPLTVASVTIAPDTGTLLPGTTRQLGATLRDGAGLFLTGRSISWTAMDTTIALVNGSGLVTAAPYGGTDTRSVGIIASNSGVSDTVVLSLPPLTAAWLTATPEALTLQPLDSATLAVAVQSVDLTVLSGRVVTFNALDATVASVDSSGRVTAAAYTGPAVRTTSIVAISGAAVDTVPVTVTPLPVVRVVSAPSAVTLAVGDSTTLTAATESASGIVLSGRTFSWLSSDTAVVRVDAAGVAHARPYAGPVQRSAFIVVYSEGVADTTTITVAPRVPNSLVVSPATVSLQPGDVTTLTTLLRTLAGDTLVAFPLTWSAADTSVARVNVEGVVTASFYVGASVRSTTVIVSTGALADTATIEVQPLGVATVAIAPDSGSLVPARTFQLDATVRDGAGLVLTDRAITWTTLDAAVASIDASGMVTALAYGGTALRAVRLVATTSSAADTVTLSVTPHAVAYVTAAPEALSLSPLDTATIGTTLAALDLTVLSDRTVTFASLDPTVAGVDASGRVTAASFTGPTLRTTVIVVTSGAATDTVPVTISPLAVERVISTPAAVTIAVGDSTTLTAATESASGIVLSGRTFSWLSSDTAVVRVDAAGVAHARPYAGPVQRSAFIVVYSEGVADTTTITVAPRVPNSLVVSPGTVSLQPGDVTTLATLVESAAGDTLTDFPLTWTASDTTIARVNTEGVVTASFYVGPVVRTTTVIVATGMLADTATIEVQPLAVASLAITPDTGSVFPSAGFQLDAALRDAGGFLLTGRPITWTSLDLGVGTVDGTGLVTALTYGGTSTRTVRIRAASATAADTIALAVRPHAVASVAATPEALSRFPRDTVTIAATLAALDLTVLTDRTVTWSAVDPTIAAVNGSGRVTVEDYTGPNIRNTAIVLSSGAVADTVPLEVLPFAVERVIASPTTLTLSPEDSTTLAVSLESATGIVLTGRNRLWLSSDTARVAVDSTTGRVVARPYAGQLEQTVNIVVYSAGKADTVVVTITPLPPTVVEVIPDSVSIFPGQQSPFTATARAASGLALTGAPITWTSSDTTVVIVNGEGVVTAVFYVGPDERTATLLASTGALADTVLVRVKALLVDTITVFPDTQTLRTEQTVQLDAVLRDSAGLFLTGRPVTWTSSDSALATVSGSGLVTARIAGTATITATSGGVSANATITITPVVTSVRVTPGLSTVWIGRTQQFAAALLDTNSVAPTGRRLTWTTSNPARATIDSLGVLTALSTGEVTIVATSEGRADSASVDVYPEPSAAITITFDDSWRGVLELAYPEMQELRLRANVGWITSTIWSGVMTPQELRVLQRAGWSIISHSMTHPYLTQISLDSARVEMAGSRARIDSLGFDPRVFVAPYLDHNAAVLLESAAVGYTYTRCCAQDTWTTDTLVDWPIPETARHRLAGVDVTNYDGQTTSYNFRTVDGRDRLRLLLQDVVARGKFIDVFFHDVVAEDVPDLRLTMAILAEFRPYLITYGMLP